MNPLSVVVSATPSSNTAGYALVDEAEVLHALTIYPEESGRSLYDAKLDAYERAVRHAAQLPDATELRSYSNGLETEILTRVSTEVFEEDAVHVRRAQHPHTAFVESLSTNQVHITIEPSEPVSTTSGVLYVDGSYLERYDSGAGGYVLFDAAEETVLDIGAFSVTPSPSVEQYTLSAALGRVLDNVSLGTLVIRTDSQCVRRLMTSQTCAGTPLAGAADRLQEVSAWRVEYLPRDENHIAHVLSQVGHRNSLALSPAA